jgi:hypothetical protein
MAMTAPLSFHPHLENLTMKSPTLTSVALLVATLLTGCGADAGPTEVNTSPSSGLQALTAAAPTISVRVPYYLRNLCYPARAYSTRGCPSGGYVSITNSGGGTLNWTSTKSATWIRRSPTYGTAPTTMKIWVDGSNLPRGDYYGWVKIWATGATNSPVAIFIHVTK